MKGPRDPLTEVALHYNSKVQAFGATALGLDWPSLSAVHDRLFALLESADLHEGSSLNDLGCGWGAAIHVVDHLYPDGKIDYVGIDVAPEMIDVARARCGARPRTCFLVGSRCSRVADFSIASGIFNVKLGASREAWERHVRATIENLHAHSICGFAFNLMLPTTATRCVPQLYCTHPEPWVQFCEALSGRRVTVRQVRDLAEFTLHVD